MKKIYIFPVVAIIAAFALMIYADAPSLPDGATAYESQIDTAVTTIDTVGTTTSQTIVLRRKLGERGWNYTLVNNTTTGANAANTELIISVLVYNSSGTLMGTHLIDTIVGASSQTFILPFHKKLVGATYTVSITGGSANGAAVYTQGFQIIKYRPTNWSK